MSGRRRLGRRSVAGLLLAIVPLVAYAQSGDEFNLVRSSSDGGGGRSFGGTFVITGTLGQADAAARLQGGAFVLHPGLWVPVEPQNVPDFIFANGFEPDPPQPVVSGDSPWFDQ
jgi:hypothetical protein